PGFAMQPTTKRSIQAGRRVRPSFLSRVSLEQSSESFQIPLQKRRNIVVRTKHAVVKQVVLPADFIQRHGFNIALVPKRYASAEYLPVHLNRSLTSHWICLLHYVAAYLRKHLG